MNEGRRLRCRELIEMLSAYVDGELDADTMLEIESHLDVCPQCVAYLKSFRATIRLGKQSATEELCDEIPDELVRVVIGKVTSDTPE